jgi:type II secretory pathway component PulM
VGVPLAHSVTGPHPRPPPEYQGRGKRDLATMASLTKRERNLAIGAGATVGALILYFFIISPLEQAWSDVENGQRTVLQQRNDAQLVFDKRDHLQKVWDKLHKAGLQSDASLAESQAENAISRIADQAGVNDVSLKTDSAGTEGSFQVTGLSMQGKGSMRQISQMIYLLESAPTPLRIISLQISPQQKEGTDDLSVQVGLSTICLVPPPQKTTANGNGAGS